MSTQEPIAYSKSAQRKNRRKNKKQLPNGEVSSNKLSENQNTNVNQIKYKANEKIQNKYAQSSKNNCHLKKDTVKCEETSLKNTTLRKNTIAANITTAQSILEKLRKLNPTDNILPNCVIKTNQSTKNDSSSLHNGFPGSIENDDIDLSIDPNTIFQNFQKLLNQTLTEDVETSDEDDEYIEYVFKPRQFFLFSLCQFCKNSENNQLIPCEKCNMVYYCSEDHRKNDRPTHHEFCNVLQELGLKHGGHIFNKARNLSPEEYRTYRVHILNTCEGYLRRQLQPFEKETILFPRICNSYECREWKQNSLINCSNCGEVAFCIDSPDHLSANHKDWCKYFYLLKELIVYQEKYGKVDPNLPSKILKEPIQGFAGMNEILKKLYVRFSDIQNECLYSAVTQIATAPLTAWYSLKVTENLSNPSLTIHLIGAELQFEADVLNKWELFFLHLSPTTKELNIIFVGPELSIPGISFESLSKIKTCSQCRKDKRILKYEFENKLYHDYAASTSYKKPDLICFFNPGLHRSTGFATEDSWPDTIRASSVANCPIIVTSYTQYESPLDLKRFLMETSRTVRIVIPPTKNIFSSLRPERNFISDEMAPIIFKNFYCFILN